MVINMDNLKMQDMTKEQIIQKLRTLSPKAKSAALNWMLQTHKDKDKAAEASSSSSENHKQTLPDEKQK